MPTTCGYQIINNIIDDKPETGSGFEEYFVMNGVVVGIELNDGTSNSFLGATFAHFTSIAMLDLIGKVISFGNYQKDMVAMVRWGSSGGSKESHKYFLCSTVRSKRR